jgi:hypothetical protein
VLLFCFVFNDHNIKLEDLINQIFELQKSNTELLEPELTFPSDCCEQTFKKVFICDGRDLCLKTGKNKTLWKEERKFTITASR